MQRLADAVAGRFCYGVMAASAATFAFWSLVGVHAFPGVVEDAMFAGGWEPSSFTILAHTEPLSDPSFVLLLCT